MFECYTVMGTSAIESKEGAVTPNDPAFRSATEVGTQEPQEAVVVHRRRRSDWRPGESRRPVHTPMVEDPVVNQAVAKLHAHDRRTGEHSDDVVALSEAIAERMGLEGVERTRVLAAAQLHDIGKVRVPNEVIDKPSPLDSHEWALMREHTVEGERMLRSIPELVEVARVVRSTHERWDGGGYPDGLTGEQIPLASRIVFCADAYHAIRCDRPYREGRTAREALAEVRANAGKQFDPRVVDALEDVAGELRTSPVARATALTNGVRSRRVVVLLLVLGLSGGGAVASGLLDVFSGDSEASAASLCKPEKFCLPAELGAFGGPFASGPEKVGPAARGGGSRPGADRAGGAELLPGPGAATPGGDQGAPGRSEDSPGGGGQGPGGSSSEPLILERPSAPPAAIRPGGTPSRGLIVPTGPGGGDPPGGGGGGGSGRPDGPGRSEEAPGHNKGPGKPPKGPGPGGSDRAPGKPPNGPGRFGLGNHLP